MLGNRSIRISLAKEETPSNLPAQVTTISVEEVTEIVQRNAAFFVVLAGAAYAGKKVIDTTSRIAIIAAESKFYA